MMTDFTSRTITGIIAGLLGFLALGLITPAAAQMPDTEMRGYYHAGDEQVWMVGVIDAESHLVALLSLNEIDGTFVAEMTGGTVLEAEEMADHHAHAWGFDAGRMFGVNVDGIPTVVVFGVQGDQVYLFMMMGHDPDPALSEAWIQDTAEQGLDAGAPEGFEEFPIDAFAGL